MVKRIATASCLLALGLGLLVQPTDARADGSANVQADHFEPFYGQGTAVLNLPKSDVIPHLRPTFGLFYHLSDALVAQTTLDANGNSAGRSSILGMSHKLELSAGMGLADWVDIGVTIPLVLSQDITRADPLPQQSSTGDFNVQDLRVSVRARLLDREKASGVGLAIALTTYIPTGDPEEFTTDGTVRLEPRIIVDWKHEDSGFTIGLNAGVQIRPERTIHNLVSGDSFRWGLLMEVPLGLEELHLLATLFGSVGFADSLDPANLDDKVSNLLNKPIEVAAALRYWVLEEHVVAQVGGGAGLTQGLGAPAWRVFASVDYSPQHRDKDEDGIRDADDKCPDKPEDKDDFQDDDGCPDPDNDGDGIADTADKCATVAEDKDGFEDTDGCPEFDNDKDGLKDKVDRCPNKAEDKDGFEDTDGCPDPDNDGDGIADGADKCPQNAEDKDGFEDSDGCPELDNDKDGIPDANDTCPNKPENKNGYQDDDGCPDDPKAKVQVTKTQVTIAGKVNFSSGKAKLRGKATFALLDEVAKVLVDNPQITKIRVEGHTDNRGNDASNLALSRKRAKAVMDYLASKGVAASRMVSEGFGESRPKVPNTSSKNRATNRRTEFFILELNGRKVEAKQPAK